MSKSEQSEQFTKQLQSLKEDFHDCITKLGLKPICNSRKGQVEWENNLSNSVKTTAVREALAKTYEESLPNSLSRLETDNLIKSFAAYFKEFEREFLQEHAHIDYEEREIKVSQITSLDVQFINLFGEDSNHEQYFNVKKNEWKHLLLSGSDSNTADANILRKECGKAFVKFVNEKVIPHLNGFKDLYERAKHIPFICAPMFVGIYETVGKGQAQVSKLVEIRFTPTNMNKAFVKVQEALTSADFHSEPKQFLTPPKLKANDRETPCQIYIDLDEIKQEYAGRENSHPTIDRMIETRVRVPAMRDVVKAWCWSILYAGNISRQALWLKGRGCDGKSVFITALSQALVKFTGCTNCVEAFQAKTDCEGSFNSKLPHAILLHDSDCRNARTIQTGILHKITGGDEIDIQTKFRNSFSTRIDAKVIIASNLWPDIDPTDGSQVSRVIPVLWTTSEKQLRDEGLLSKNGLMLGSATFKQKVIEEMPFWLADCESAYKELCPCDATIDFPKESLLNCYDVELEDIPEVIKTAGYEDTQDPSDAVPQPEFLQAIKNVRSMKKPDGSMPYHHVTLQQISEHLDRSNVELKHKRYGVKIVRAYIGVKKLEEEKPNKSGF